MGKAPRRGLCPAGGRRPALGVGGLVGARLDNGDDAGGGHLGVGPVGSHGAGKALQGLILATEGVKLQAHGSILPGQLVHLPFQLHLLLLQLFLLADTLYPAAGSVTPVLQCPPALLQPRHLLLGEAPQVVVELPH